jgi:hypothetical protein
MEGKISSKQTKEGTRKKQTSTSVKSSSLLVTALRGIEKYQNLPVP